MSESGKRPRMAAIGMFDGVHLGHQWLLSGLNATAAFNGYEPMIVTFDRHPLSMIASDRAPKLLMTPTERFRTLRSKLGLVAVVDFTDEIRRMTAREFMIMLRDRYGVKAIYMGFNHRFGSDRLQEVDEYKAVAAGLGMEIFDGTEQMVHGEKVSSSIIRELIAAGDEEKAAECLERPYRIMGYVEQGKQLGRTIGFPTANLHPDDDRQLIPGNGVYECRAINADGKEYKAMVNIGVRPTVDDSGRVTIEAHLLDFSGDLYGRVLTLDFLRRIRDEHHFGSAEELRKQLVKDAESIRGVTSAGRKP